MKDEDFYYEALKEIKKLREEITDELDSLYVDIKNLQNVKAQIRELQEEVAKLAGEPVSILFTNYRA